jgi:hypothetical protein
VAYGNVQWDWGSDNGQVDTNDVLPNALVNNFHPKVFPANDIYNIAPAFFATEYNMNHIVLDRSMQAISGVNYIYWRIHADKEFSHESKVVLFGSYCPNFVNSAPDCSQDPIPNHKEG